jgi:8-amino-7-oxononanoate synthase
VLEHGLDSREPCVSISTAVSKALGVSGALSRDRLGDRLSDPAGAAVRVLDGGAARIAAAIARASTSSREPDRRTQLMDRVKRLRAAMSASGLPVPASFSQILPVVIGENERALDAAAALQAQGFDVRAIRPPSVAPGTARLRISVNVTLTDEAIDSFVRALVAVVGVGAFGGISSGSSLSWSAASS